MEHENLNTESEMDFDNWLATGERTAHHVPVYGRLDLLAEIEALEAQLPEPKTRPAMGEQVDPDATLGGDDPTPEEALTNELNAQISELWFRIDASKRIFRVSGLTSEETSAIREEVLNDLSDELDKASKWAQAEARKTCKRMDLTAPADVNLIIRQAIKEATDKIVQQEVAIRAIAAAAKFKAGDDYQSLTPDNVRSLKEKLGEVQLDRLADASLRARTQAPEVTIPKS